MSDRILTVDAIIRETEKSWQVKVGDADKPTYLAFSLFEQVGPFQFRPLTGFAKSLVKKIEAAA